LLFLLSFRSEAEESAVALLLLLLLLLLLFLLLFLFFSCHPSPKAEDLLLSLLPCALCLVPCALCSSDVSPVTNLPQILGDFSPGKGTRSRVPKKAAPKGASTLPKAGAKPEGRSD
jgi:hypothetical protein